MLHARYQTFIFLALTLLLCGFSNSNNANYSQDKIQKQFLALQSQYFQVVNLSAAPQMVRTIPAFSAKLNKLADMQRAVLAANPNMSQTDKELAGLIFIYDAMLTLDGCNAVMLGKLSLSDFEKVHRFAKSGSTAKEELQARVNYAISELETAAKLRPNDH